MRKRVPRKSDQSACLFLVPPEPPPPAKLIEWPEDEAEAAALRDQCRRMGDDYRALLATGHDEVRWHEPIMKIVRARREYLMAHKDAVREVGGRTVFSDGYRRFVVALARGPGEGMTLAALAWASDIPVSLMSEWLHLEPEPGS